MRAYPIALILLLLYLLQLVDPVLFLLQPLSSKQEVSLVPRNQVGVVGNQVDVVGNLVDVFGNQVGVIVVVGVVSNMNSGCCHDHEDTKIELCLKKNQTIVYQ